MIPLPQPTATGVERQDLHNAGIDEVAAADGSCGALHLPSGRVCRKQARHADGCEFRALS